MAFSEKQQKVREALVDLDVSFTHLIHAPLKQRKVDWPVSDLKNYKDTGLEVVELFSEEPDKLYVKNSFQDLIVTKPTLQFKAVYKFKGDLFDFRLSVFPRPKVPKTDSEDPELASLKASGSIPSHLLQTFQKASAEEHDGDKEIQTDFEDNTYADFSIQKLSKFHRYMQIFVNQDLVLAAVTHAQFAFNKNDYVLPGSGPGAITPYWFTHLFHQDIWGRAAQHTPELVETVKLGVWVDKPSAISKIISSYVNEREEREEKARSDKRNVDIDADIDLG